MARDKHSDIKELALQDLKRFIKLVHPKRVLGHVHEELINWWQREEASSHQLVLLPRDHQKSALVAYRVAWEITRRPWIKVLYISSTSKLAIKQLKFIKDILTTETYRKFWPEMVHQEEAKREKWTETEIAVDHPLRRQKNVRDATVFTAGLTTNIVGLHCDIAVLDDVVVDDSAYSPEGREKVKDQVSYLASVAGTDSKLWAVGTRYHPQDLYNDMKEMIVEELGKNGEISNSYTLYEIYEKQVEDAGDGTGEYIWPRMQNTDGDWFGFDQSILARKRAQYSDPAKFRAQYYNNPNYVGNATITTDMFQYFDRARLSRHGDKWYYGDNKLNVFAAVDFAWSNSKSADYTAIVVVAIDRRNNYYVLDIDRFKTKLISDYFDRILRLYSKWGFHKLSAEVIAAQEVIVEDLKANYIKPFGLSLAVENHRPTKQKEERIEATLQPKYSNRQMWHYKGTYTELLEEELSQQRPSHDDIKDALTSAVQICIAPSATMASVRFDPTNFYNNKFGGVA